MTDEEVKKIISRIDFEEKWLCDVYTKEYRISIKDVEIAMNAIRSVVAGLKKESEK